MSRTPDYEPPVHDPRARGAAEWEQLRNAYLTTRDALASAQAQIEAYARQIDMLNENLKQAKAIEAEAMREAISYRTSIRAAGMVLEQILKRGDEDRRGGDVYAKPAQTVPLRGDPVDDGDLRELRELVSDLGRR